MKWLNILFTAMLLCVLGACAGNQAQTASNDTDSSSVDKYQKAVQANAEKKNIGVYWVNPPDEQDLKKYEDDEG
jgi:hypothetical protein